MEQKIKNSKKHVIQNYPNSNTIYKYITPITVFLLKSLTITKQF